jgi:ParB family transcriptional regulator, chromosome partitioning protein
MKLTHLPLDQLKLSTVNVRSTGGKEVADLLPSIRSLGIIQPLLVRPNCEGFEIIAGQRRYHALVKLADEGIIEPVPVGIMEDGDDAKAIEASLAENVARLPMDEIDQYEAFAAMKAAGIDVAEIAARFGVTERLVEQRLAIAGIIDPILNAYRREEIEPSTLRALTMATAKKQKAWWKLFKSEDAHAPTGSALRRWLLGGDQIPTSNALFDVTLYKGGIVADLFGEDSYFSDSEAFWPLQNAAIAERREAYLAAGWHSVEVLDVGERFASWAHAKTTKKKGGKVFIAIAQDGEVAFHEGWLSEKEARRKANVQTDDSDAPAIKSERPELTKAMQNYLGLHKHAAVRTELLAHPGIALRLAVAHMIAGSRRWHVEADDQRADSNAIRDSIRASKAEIGFAEERGRIRTLLDLDDEGDHPIVPRPQDYGLRRDLGDTFAKLCAMDDASVLRIMTFVMAETLEAQTSLVEMLGVKLSTDMGCWWKPDQPFFDLLRDKEAINGIVREVAGDRTADAHIASTAKVQKKIIADCITGEGREKAEGWLPRYMAFPSNGYTSRFVDRASHAPERGEDEGDEDFDSPDLEAA